MFLVRIENKKSLIIICSTSEVYGNVSKKDIYNIVFGGFDDCNTETDSEDMNTEEEDNDYNPEDNDTEEEYEILSGNESELEEDNNEY